MALLFCNDLLSTASSHKDAKRSQCFALPELPGAEPPERLSDREGRSERERRRGSQAGDSGPEDDDPFDDRNARRRRALDGVPLLPFGGVGLEQHGATFSGRATSSKPATARRMRHPSTAPPGPTSARLGAAAAARRTQQALEEGLADQPQPPSQKQQGSDGLLLGSDAFGSLWDEWRHVLSPASKLVAQKPLALAGGPGSQATTSAASLGPKASTHSGAWRGDRKGVALPSLTGTARDTGGSAGAWTRAAHHKEWERPGSQLTGRLAIAEGGSLSAQYSLICKEDVTKACSRQDVASRSAAAWRRDCAAKQGRLARQRAARWRGRTTDATSVVGTPKTSSRHSPDHASLHYESDGESEPHEGDAPRSDEHEGYPRWKRALDRIAARDTEKEDVMFQKQLTGGLEGEGQPQQLPPPQQQHQQQEQHTEDLARLFVSHVKSETDGGGCAGEPRRLGWRRKTQATLDAHIASLYRLRKIEERVKKLQRAQDARQRRFYQLPQEEMQMSLDILKYCCKEDERAETLVLNAAQLRLCAVEAGLGGIGSEEQVAVLNLCEEVSRSPNEIVYNAGGDGSGPLFEVKTGVNLFTFACSFLPSIRKALQFIRSERLEEVFDECDLEQKGSLDLNDCCAIAATFSGCRDDAAIRQMATEIIEEDQQQQLQKDASDRQNVVPRGESPRRSLMDSTIAKNFRRPLGTRQLTRKEEELLPPTMSGDQLKRLVDVVCQDTRRKFHGSERGLQQQTGLEESVFLRLRPDVPLLMKLYQRRKAKPSQTSDTTHEGLSTEGCMQVLLEFGLRYKRRSSDRGGSDLEVVESQAEKARKQGERMIGFKTLLSIVEKVRRKREFHEYESMQDNFMSFAASESRIGATAEQPLADGIAIMSHRGDDEFGARPKYIPLMSASKFIEWARCLPRRRELPEAVAQALEDHLTYSTECLQHKDIPPGTIGFPALVRVLQRASEYLARLDFAREAKVAVDHGFQASELAELHSVFDKLDDDNNGTLSKMEVWEAIKNLGFKLKTSQFEVVFKQCDVDRSGSIDFLEFVGLLGLARDEVGGFSQNRPITFLTDLKQMEVQRLLGFYGRTWAVAAEGTRRPQLSSERPVGQGSGHAKEAQPEEDAPDPRDLDELCDCLGVSTGASLLETIKVRTVQELFSFALTRIDDASE